jgi:L-lactate dehydrogenase complex protein LldG
LDGAAEEIERIIAAEQASRVATSDSSLVQDLMRRVKSDITLFENPAGPELFNIEIGVTAVQWAIAETGTLVLVSGREINRLLSLVPPTHVALVRQSSILGTIGQALGALHPTKASDPSPAITFITGPSRTADIELTLTIGVHGPRSLYVIILSDQ